MLGLLGPNGAGQDDRRAHPHHAAGARRRAPRASPASTSSATPTRLRSHIGLAGQYAAVDENLTGFENLDMVGRLYHLRKATAKERAHELLERFELTDAADRPVKTYSGGMRRRLDLAAAPGRPPARALPRRADHRPGSAQPRRPVGDDRGARRRGHDRPAHHAVPRRGRPARRPDRRDRPRPGDRRGHLATSSSRASAASGSRSRCAIPRTSSWRCRRSGEEAHGGVPARDRPRRRHRRRRRARARRRGGADRRTSRSAARRSTTSSSTLTGHAAEEEEVESDA